MEMKHMSYYYDILICHVALNSIQTGTFMRPLILNIHSKLFIIFFDQVYPCPCMNMVEHKYNRKFLFIKVALMAN